MDYPFTVVIDTREQTPFRFPSTAKTVTGTLVTGDYSIEGLEEQVAIERKSLDDLVGCCVGDNRDRFKRELKRLRAFACTAVVIEGDVGDVYSGNFHSKINANSVMMSVSKWMVSYRVPFIFAGREHGPDVALCLMRGYWLRLQDFVKVFQQPVLGSVPSK